MTDIATAVCASPDHAALPKTACPGCAAACQAELTALNDRYMRLLGDRREHQKITEAAARRTADGHMRAFAHLYLPKIIDELTGLIRPVLYRASNVDPARARTTAERAQHEMLRNGGEIALQAWDEATGGRTLSGAFDADPREAEIARLRDVITGQGQALHERYAPPFDGFDPCRCPGCGLIRAMDAQPDATVAAAEAAGG